MGAAIDAISTIEGHQSLGKTLNTFAGNCREIVAKHEGTLIFAGGDDVLALLPLHQAIACARALNRSFHETVELPLQKTLANVPGRKPASLSVGIGISHCREPMSDARALARKAEGIAKKVPGKNAF
ncbi:MAG: type III-B CRISPR-associated protein Cas10/Cmr2, partial [bacterium]